MGIDFNKLNPEEAQKIISALKDGRINEHEAKTLGLTAQEQEALNKAFSSGEVQIGDFILINKGKSDDGKVQYSTTKRAGQEASKEEEQGFFSKAFNKVKEDLGGYVKNFSNAWNNSEGILGTTGAMVGAVTKTATDVVKDYAENVEKGVANLTGSETAGQVASHALGVGFAADAAEAVEKFGNWSSGKIREAAQNYTGTERELLLGFADAVDDMNAADIALMFAGGAGVAKYAKDLPKILSLLQKAAVPAAGVAVVGTMASCSPDEISQNVNLTINANSSLEDAVNALLMGQEVTNQILSSILETSIKNGTTLDEIKDMVGDQTWVLERLVESMTENNQLLTDIRNSITTGTDDILNALISIQNSIDVLTSLVAEQPEYGDQLQAILDAIETGNKSLDEVTQMVQELLTKVAANGDTQVDILAKLEEIQNSNLSAGEKLVAMLELLKNIDNKLNVVINQINEAFNNDKEVQVALDKLTQLVEEGNAKADVTNEMLSKLLEMMGNGVSKEDIKAIIEAISNNGDKIDDVNFFLNKIQNQDLEFQQKVLDMMAKYGDIALDILETAKGSDAKLDAIAQLLAKIQGQDETFQKNVLEMLKNVGGGDYTEILNKILEAEQANGGKLDGIAQLLAKIQNQDAEFQQNVLKVLEDLGTSSTTVLNEILASIGNNGDKLNDIAQLLAKIDSNVEKYGEEGKALGQQILEAINKFGADISGKLTQILNVANSDQENGKNIQALLEKVLAKMDDNTVAIIDAIGNIEVGNGGNVDLSSLEAMLKDLIQLTSKNNGLLESIDGKMDVINLTIERAKEEILAKMDASDANTTAILNALNEFKNISSANDKEILEKMDTIINVLNNIKDNKYDDTALMAKLDDILAAIKDHNITVDITGKVECNCNCGQPHEGIIGDLEDILG